MSLDVPTVSTSFRSARAEPASISALSWQFQTLALSCAWRGKPSQSQDWHRRWKTVSWLQRLSGLMCEPSTAAHGVAWWMASLAASRASLTPSPGSSLAKKTNATSGRLHAKSSSKRVRGLSSSKTSKGCSTLVDLNGSVGSFDAFVSRLRSDYSARQNAARRTSAIVSSSLRWLSPTKEDHHSVSAKETKMMSLYASGISIPDTYKRLRSQAVATDWSTPRASDAEKGGPNQSFGAGGMPLPAQAAQWGTPTVRDHKDGTAEACANVPVNGLLGRQAAQWVTPTVNGNTNRKGSSATSQDGLATQATDRFSRPDQATSTDGDTTSNSGRSLNQRFVGWLMGWPDGWTSFECLATELFHWKQRMRFALSQLDLHDAPPAQNDLFA